jgi:hypothetical protein
MGSLSSLQVLDMASCNLHGEIPTTFSQLKNLDMLFLQVNRLTGHIPHLFLFASQFVFVATPQVLKHF